MAIRKINPTSPGQRGMTKSDYQEITTSTPEKSLLKKLNKTSGRNTLKRVSFFVGNYLISPMISSDSRSRKSKEIHQTPARATTV